MLTDDGRPSRLWATILAVVCPGLGHRYLLRPFAATGAAVIALAIPGFLLAEFPFMVGLLGPAGAYTSLFLAPGLVAIASVFDIVTTWDEEQSDVGTFAPLALHATLTGLLAFGVAVAVPSLFVERYVVPSSSMMPLLGVGDELHVDSRVTPSELLRGDVVVVRDGVVAKGEKETFLVKRIVGLSGDTLIFDDGKIVSVDIGAPSPGPRPAGKVEHCEREGKFLECIDGRCWALEAAPAQAAYGESTKVSFSVPEPQIFLAGDNRNNSEDSRARAAVKRPPIGAADVVGRVLAHRHKGGLLLPLDIDSYGKPLRCSSAL